MALAVRRDADAAPAEVEGWAPRDERCPTWLLAVAGLLGALPTLIELLLSPSLFVDDWWLASVAKLHGFAGFGHLVDVRSRPLQALYYGVTFTLFGGHPVPHLLLLAVTNAAAGLLVAALAWRWLPSRLAVVVTLIWLALPERGASHLWIAASSSMNSLVLMLLALWLASRARPKVWLVVGVVAVGVLAYEGGLGIGAGAVALAAWRSSTDRPAQLRRLAGGGAVLVALALWNRLTTPKTPGAFRIDVRTILASNFGGGLLSEARGSASWALLALLLLAVVLNLLPTFRRLWSSRLLVAGGVLWVLGVLPFVLGSFPISLDGMFDRGNTFATLGVALLIGGVIELAWQERPMLGMGLAAVLLVVLGASNVKDLADQRHAARDGREVLANLDAVAGRGPGKVVLEVGPYWGGWNAFGFNSIGSAVLVRDGQRRPGLSDSGGPVDPHGPGVVRIGLVDGRLVRLP